MTFWETGNFGINSAGEERHCIDDVIAHAEDHLIRGAVVEAIPGIMPPGKKIRLADIGCGDPKRTRRLLQGLTTVDARFYDRKGKDSSIYKLDITHDSADPADIVLCCRVFGNIKRGPDRRRGFLNLYESVKPGGKLIFIDGFERQRENVQRARQELGYVGLPPSSSGSTCITEEDENTLRDVFSDEHCTYIAPDYTIWTRLQQKELLPYGAVAALAHPVYSNATHDRFAFYQMRVFTK